MKRGGGQVSGIAVKGCWIWGRRLGQRGATAVQRWRKAELEGGAGGRRERFARMKRRGGQVSDIAFNVKRRRGCAVALLEARRYVHYSAQVGEGGLKARAFPPRRLESVYSDPPCRTSTAKGTGQPR
jgi:hypothetical protein